jgi:isopentenyldiphosphate isomerase
MSGMNILNNDELLEAWDWDTGKPTGVSVKRGDSYRYGIAHEGVHLWIVRNAVPDMEILFQHRSKSKALYPDCLDITVGGHVTFGLERGKIKKEAMEEIGIDIHESELADLGYCRFEEKTDISHHREFQHVYLLEDGRSLDCYRFNDGEVAGIFAIPSQYLESLLFKDSSLAVKGFNGTDLVERTVSRRNFHPMLFDKRMALYMSIVIKAARELILTGKVTAAFPGL